MYAGLYPQIKRPHTLLWKRNSLQLCSIFQTDPGGFGVFIYIIRDVGKKCMVYLFASKKRRKNIILELTRDDVIWNENNFVIASG